LEKKSATRPFNWLLERRMARLKQFGGVKGRSELPGMGRRSNERRNIQLDPIYYTPTLPFDKINMSF